MVVGAELDGDVTFLEKSNQKTFGWGRIGGLGGDEWLGWQWGLGAGLGLVGWMVMGVWVCCIRWLRAWA